MRCLPIIALLLGMFSAGAHAHDWWIHAHPVHPAPGSEVRLAIGGGHSFPESEELLAARLLAQTVLTGPDTEVPLDFAADNKQHVAAYTLQRKGVYRADFHVQRPGDEAPLIAGRALVVAGAADDPAAYAANDGLEIVPLKPVSDWRAGGEVPLEVRSDGEVVASMIRLERATGRPVRMRSAPGRPAVFRHWQAGPSLFITEYRGQTATLTVWTEE